MSDGVVREVGAGRPGAGWGGGESREWLAIAATAPLPILALCWALLVSRAHRRAWRPMDVLVAALLCAGIAKQALTLAFALLALLLPAPSGIPDDDGGGGWSWDSSAGGGSREEALCSAAVWGLTSAHALQAAALASLAADRALLALGSRPRRFRAAQARYHVCVLAVVSALVGAAGVFSRGGNSSPSSSSSEDPCLFLPHQLDSRFALFWICLHGGLVLSGAALAAMVTARLCCCRPGRAWRRDEEEEALPLPSPCDTSTAASTASTTASGRCGSTAALYAAAAPTSGGKCACGEMMSVRWTEAPGGPNRGDLRAELRWPSVLSLMALCYLLNHGPVLAVTVLGTLAPRLLPRRWPLGTVVLWAGVAQDALLPLVLVLSDARFAGWARRVYSGSSTTSDPSAQLSRRQHQQQQQLRQQQLEQRRREQQQHLLHQQLQQQLLERRRRLEMTLESPLPTPRAEPRADALAPPHESGAGDIHLAPPWKQNTSVSVESLFTSKSDLSQQMSPLYSQQTLSAASSGLGSTTSSSAVGGRDVKFPLTNGSLFTVSADGRYPVARNYRRGSNGGLHTGRIGLQVVTNPRCDANSLSSVRSVVLPNAEAMVVSGDTSGGRKGPRGRQAPVVERRLTVVDRPPEEEEDSDSGGEEPIYATLSSLEDCEEDQRPASPMSSCSVTTAANDDFEYRDAKGGVVEMAPDDEPTPDDSEVEEEALGRAPDRSVPSALGLYRLRLDELAEAPASPEEEEDGADRRPRLPGGALIRSPHNFHRRRYRRVLGHQQRRLGVVLSVDSLQTALSRPDAVAYLDNGERMSGSVPDFKKVFVSEFI